MVDRDRRDREITGKTDTIRGFGSSADIPPTRAVPSALNDTPRDGAKYRR
jgi:hypothetical protein